MFDENSRIQISAVLSETLSMLNWSVSYEFEVTTSIYYRCLSVPDPIIDIGLGVKSSEERRTI